MHPPHRSAAELDGAVSMSKEDKCEMIADTPLFSDFHWNDVEALAAYVQCHEIPAGSTIFNEGDAGSYMALLIKGQVEIIKHDHEGKPHRIVLITRGKTIGEMSIIDGEPRSATCVASQESVLLVLTKENYGRIIKERPALAVQILSKLAKLMSQRLRGVSGQLVEFLEQEGD